MCIVGVVLPILLKCAKTPNGEHAWFSPVLLVIYKFQHQPEAHSTGLGVNLNWYIYKIIWHVCVAGGALTASGPALHPIRSTRNVKFSEKISSVFCMLKRRQDSKYFQNTCHNSKSNTLCLLSLRSYSKITTTLIFITFNIMIGQFLVIDLLFGHESSSMCTSFYSRKIFERWQPAFEIITKYIFITFHRAFGA